MRHQILEPPLFGTNAGRSESSDNSSGDGRLKRLRNVPCSRTGTDS